jgi:hypothetical protein
MLNSITITDGTAELLGEGVAVVQQGSEEGPQNVVLTVADVRDLLVALGG